MQDIQLALLENYNIVVHRIERIEYGLWEKNYKVYSDNDMYFVKQFWGTWRLEKNYAEMIRGINLGQEIREQDIPVPLHINDVNGNILSRHGEHTYQVNEWICGITYRPGVIPNEVAHSMGELLGDLHLKFNNSFKETYVDQIDIDYSIQRKKELIDRLRVETFDNKEEILSALNKQLILLNNHHKSDFGIFTKVGRIYNSYWIEQLLFDEAHQVKGLIDWTDGAGGLGNIIDDIDTAYFVSAFDLDGIINFAKGYQGKHQLSELEWQSIVEYTCTRHLDTNWIYESWIKGRSNRYEHWKTTARKWIAGIEYRYLNKDQIWKAIESELDFAK